MDYNKQANDFAEKIGLTMSAQYIGHFKRLGDWSTANYRIVLRRPGRKEYSFEFSTSLRIKGLLLSINLGKIIFPELDSKSDLI